MFEIIAAVISARFDPTISVGHIIASATFIVSTLVAVWRIGKAIRDRNEHRLGKLEQETHVIMNDVAWIKLEIQQLLRKVDNGRRRDPNP